jgi:hypothetical protein
METCWEHVNLKTMINNADIIQGNVENKEKYADYGN